MDPTSTYLDMQEYMKEGAHEDAREAALNLKLWLSKGGFYPAIASKLDVDLKVHNVLYRTRYLKPVS